MEKEKIVVVGFGWASIGFLQYIDDNLYDIVVLSKDDKFVYSPLLAQNVKQNYDLTIPIKSLKKNLTFVQDNVEHVDFQKKIVKTNHNYDFLIFSHGAEVNTFQIPGVEKYTYYLKTFEDSLAIKEKLQELPPSSKIAVIGCGLAGSELVGSLSDMKKFQIFAIDALERPVITFDKTLSEKVVQTWEKQNITMLFQSFVQEIKEKSLKIKDKEDVHFDMAVWCGGIKMSALSQYVNKTLGLQNNRGIPVDSYLQVQDQKDLFAMGDCAYSGHPPTAQVAYQQGIYLAKQFNQKLPKTKEFSFENKGQIGYIGNGQSIYQNTFYKGGGKVMHVFNNIVHLYNFGKIYVKSRF